MTKEDRIKESNRKYYAANKEKIALAKSFKYKNDLEYRAKVDLRNLEWNKNNKVKVLLNKKTYRDSLKDGKTTLYYLPEHHYIGVTKEIKQRMNVHRSRHNRYTDNVEIVAKFDTRAEALHYEKLLHSIGYNG